eukprot:3293377-Alexandrium_andersonii.AAC.2
MRSTAMIALPASAQTPSATRSRGSVHAVVRAGPDAAAEVRPPHGCRNNLGPRRTAFGPRRPKLCRPLGAALELRSKRC